MVRSAFLAVLAAGAISVMPAAAQAPPAPPDHYALTNARIVTAPGQVIENGTVIVRNGRIVAVGRQVAVPATAIALNLAGLTVYPGLIDAASSLGLPTFTRQGGGGGGGAGGGAAAAPAPDEVAPGRSAAEQYEPTDEELEAIRNAGITTVGLAFDGGIFPGRVAAVNTGGAPATSPVLNAEVAQQVLLGRRRGQYPGTLMASIAFVKQSFFDAQHGVRTRQAWERQPTGPRPAFDPHALGLEAAASGSLPVWFFVSSRRDIGRINDIAAEIGVRNYTIVGAQEGWMAVDELKRAGGPVVVSLDWPAPGQITGRAFEQNVAPVSGENEAAEQADSAAAREARANPAALARAGVPFALTGYGLSAPAQLRTRVRAAIEAGLSADDALRALTVTPARLLGIEEVAGTIAPGRIANLVITQGDLFAADSRVRHVFVDGVRYDVPVPAARPANAQRAAGPAAVAGEWVGEIDGPAGLMQFVLTIRGGAADSLTGSMTSEMGNVALTGERTGAELTLRGTASPPGMNAMAISITGRVTGDELRGTLTAQGRSPINFTARRRAPGADNREGGR